MTQVTTRRALSSGPPGERCFSRFDRQLLVKCILSWWRENKPFLAEAAGSDLPPYRPTRPSIRRIAMLIATLPLTLLAGFIALAFWVVSSAHHEASLVLEQ